MNKSSSRPMRVGLTGGIASGKSKVADLFAARGIPVIDTDILARQVVMPGKPGLAAVTGAFGKAILHPDGTLDRAKLRRIVFADQAMRERLDKLLHPLILDAALSAADIAGGPYQIFAVPLLAETAFDKQMDRVLVIDTTLELQRQWLMSRDKESARSADAMIAAQASREQRLAIADDVILNDGSLQDLEANVERLHRRYLVLCAEGGRQS